jgi:hypothetical protein
MSRTRIPKAIMYYQPRGKRSLGRPMKRWLKILCLDHNRPLRPRTCKEEEEEMSYGKKVLVIWGSTFILLLT